MYTDHTRRFADRFAEFAGARYAMPFWKGRVALYAICRAVGLGPGDEVILPGYTCVMDVNPIMYTGATVRYADIDPATFNAPPATIESLISERTRVIVAQHTYGVPCDMNEMRRVADRAGAWLVEDCCQALGASDDRRRVGRVGDAAYWSFQWNKMVSTGLGGVATTSHPGLGEALEEVTCREAVSPGHRRSMMLAAQRLAHRALVWPRTAAAVRWVFRKLTEHGVVIGSSDQSEFTPVKPDDFFMTMSQAQARSGLRRMATVEDNLAHRRAIVRCYDALLGDAGWPSRGRRHDGDDTLVAYPVRVTDKQRVLAEAPRNMVEIGSWFESPLHPEETPLERYGYQWGLCPEAEKASQEVVTLPTHPRVSEAEARRTVAYLLRTTAPALPQ